MPDPRRATPEPAPAGVPADPATNTLVKLVLRSGLVVALLLLLVGLIAQLVSTGRLAVEVKMFDVFGAPTLGQKLMGLGVLVLTLIPVAAILSVLVSWIREHDARFSAVAAVVLAVLAAAVVVGLAG